jgi:hypothetical protein
MAAQTQVRFTPKAQEYGLPAPKELLILGVAGTGKSLTAKATSTVFDTPFPLPQRMDRFYGFELQMFQLTLPEKMSVDLISMAEQQEVMMARDKATQEASAKIHRDVELFVGECVASLREQTATLCEEMPQSINSSETGVHQKTLNRLVKFIDQ